MLRIDADGQVWRCAIRTRSGWKDVAPRRAENKSGNGYLRVTLHVPGQGLVQVMAHRLVYASLVGPVPADMQINHRDLDKRNNRPSNLEVVTGAGNIQHSYANGRVRPWSKKARAGEWRVGRALLTEEQVLAVRARRAAGARLKDISTEFGISTSHAHRLCAQRAP
ncbi:HNH endonuclease [Myxococcus sp. K38C18041901]|uniref:HNH endonuclease signature motif containing protein n=1 Tax=Myxococcus guangdongensis TaxID=2906760 RepID=UPI0020A76A4D|nr:HNH endonuclease [Myxococcus guangdongensis]MCP3065300.1 HNH endonuclease [Myxococcus guangdongensis]